MNELSVIGGAINVASDVASTVNCVATTIGQVNAGIDTRRQRKARSKTIYAIDTIAHARQMTQSMNLTGKDLVRAELFMDAYTRVAFDDISNT